MRREGRSFQQKSITAGAIPISLVALCCQKGKSLSERGSLLTWADEPRVEHTRSATNPGYLLGMRSPREVGLTLADINAEDHDLPKLDLPMTNRVLFVFYAVLTISMTAGTYLGWCW